MLAGRFPVLMFSFIIRMLVSFWVEIKKRIAHVLGLNVNWPLLKQII